MYILGIETATPTGGVAIVSEEGVIAEYTLNVEVAHAERLMSSVDRVLRDSGIPLSAVGGFGVSIGPGSFTGLRIGLATVKGLAFATGSPVAAVPTLKALAWRIACPIFPVCPVLDARKQQVYAALYRREADTLIEMIPETVTALADLATKIKGDVLFTGEGARLFEREIRRAFAGRAHIAPLAALVPSAASVAEIAHRMMTAGLQTDPDALTPKYIRRPEAEVAWEQRRRSR